MKMPFIRVLTLMLIALPVPGWSGMQIELVDPLYFERPHEVIFPWADAKLVTFEFEAVAGTEGGKRRARELHDQFLSKIQGLPGGAILTFISPEGQRIENYRFTAAQAARQQKAQMSLWGRMFPDESGAALINVRLELIEPPNGIQAPYESRIRMPEGQRQPVLGFITDEISQTRIDFLTVKETRIDALADFLSGLAFYYKGAKNSQSRARQLLQTSVQRLQQYVDKTRDQIDASAASVAHVYMARAKYHLSTLSPDERRPHLASAERHANLAIELNPYEPDPYTVLAVIHSAAGGGDPQKIADLLSKAVKLAPGSPTSSYNLALVNSGSGRLQAAIQRLEQVEYLQRQQEQATFKELQSLQNRLRTLDQEQISR